MTLHAVLFGIDGVLAETEEVRRETHNTVFVEASLDWHWSRALYADLLKTTGGEDMITAFVEARVPQWRHTADLRSLISIMKRRQASLYRERLDAGDVELRPGLAGFLRLAEREGIRLAIATEDSTANTASLLQSVRNTVESTSFEVVSTPGTGRANVHTEALSALELEPCHCLAIESSVRGMRSAVAAGVPTVITWGIYPQLQECGEALLDGASSLPGSSMILARWDTGSPAELLARLRSHHAAQRPAFAALAPDLPSAWSRSDKELDYVGVRHFEN